jgi:glycosyltransferase involved in cell wall biosynthesis
MDVYPDIASDIGIFRKQGMLEKVSGTILDWSRRRADIIIVIGEDMRTRILARGISPLKIRVAENWADGATIVPTTFPDGPLTVHYSGNLGLAHEVATIAGVMGHFANHRNFHFIFSGGGPRRPELEAYCRAQSIRNVEFRPFCASDKLSESLGQGHLGLITQLPETLGSVVPSKIYGIMAAGRPVLYIGPDGSTAVRHIQNFNCGWRLQPGDVEGVIRLLNHLDLNRHLLSEAGERGRIAFERNFDRTIGVARILAIVLGSPLKESSA